ncbi:MAG: LptF/LptG family permease [Lewinellaceae bacterium]|nr:LptF/LptG family permease [Lewinellaceae bacterium]
MKKVDNLLLTSFLPPFFVTFMIAMFVLVMQVLWLYIDDIAGKGLGFFLIMELLAYKCVALIPMALPLAVLISSVMVLGNLAERYELSSFKSAGVPLLRIMRTMVFFGAFTVGLSFFCSNNLIPVANLKFGSRMYDIQRQKPALRLDAGIFNDDFDGYAIHIGKKEPDGKTIEDVLIYDHTDAAKGRLSQILAQQGEMFATADGHYFVMNLKHGHQYIETEPALSGGGRSYPFVRTNFDSWTKVFDLSEFQLNRTNEELFKSNRSMMTSGQLREAIDSLSLKILRREKGLSNQISAYFYFMYPDSAFMDTPASEDDDEPAGQQQTTQQQAATDTSATVDKAPEAPADSGKAEKLALTSDRAIAEYNKRKATQPPKQIFEGRPIKQLREEPLEQDTSFIQLFNKVEQRRLLNKAKSYARSIHAHSESATHSLGRLLEARVKHIYELHTKYSMALICLIFVFIGAPMGAIVRKGGFGYPILISIIFFMLFIVLTIFCRKIAESFVLPASVAAWIPCGILFPIGLILTSRAMNDRKLLNPDRINNFFAKVFKRRSA